MPPRLAITYRCPECGIRPAPDRMAALLDERRGQADLLRCPTADCPGRLVRVDAEQSVKAKARRAAQKLRKQAQQMLEEAGESDWAFAQRAELIQANRLLDWDKQPRYKRKGRSGSILFRRSD